MILQVSICGDGNRCEVTTRSDASGSDFKLEPQSIFDFAVLALPTAIAEPATWNLLSADSGLTGVALQVRQRASALLD